MLVVAQGNIFVILKSDEVDHGQCVLIQLFQPFEIVTFLYIFLPNSPFVLSVVETNLILRCVV